MSNWTHVAGVARIDDMRIDENYTLDFDKIFGKECLWGSPEELWIEASEHPERFLPIGSEGSLHKSIWEDPDRSSLAAYTVMIFGDLRDHEDPEAIINWFRDVLRSLNVRQATITARNGWNGTRNWSYNGEEEIETDEHGNVCSRIIEISFYKEEINYLLTCLCNIVNLSEEDSIGTKLYHQFQDAVTEIENDNDEFHDSETFYLSEDQANYIDDAIGNMDMTTPDEGSAEDTVTEKIAYLIKKFEE